MTILSHLELNKGTRVQLFCLVLAEKQPYNARQKKSFRLSGPFQSICGSLARHEPKVDEDSLESMEKNNICSSSVITPNKATSTSDAENKWFIQKEEIVDTKMSENLLKIDSPNNENANDSTNMMQTDLHSTNNSIKDQTSNNQFTNSSTSFRNAELVFEKASESETKGSDPDAHWRWLKMLGSVGTGKGEYQV